MFEPDEKQIYIYNSTWGRGLDIVHDAFGMPMTKQYKDKLQEDKKGYASTYRDKSSASNVFSRSTSGAVKYKTRFLQGFSIVLAEGFSVRAEHIPQVLSAYAGTLLLRHF